MYRIELLDVHLKLVEVYLKFPLHHSSRGAGSGEAGGNGLKQPNPCPLVPPHFASAPNSLPPTLPLPPAHPSTPHHGTFYLPPHHACAPWHLFPCYLPPLPPTSPLTLHPRSRLWHEPHTGSSHYPATEWFSQGHLCLGTGRRPGPGPLLLLGC